MKKGLPAWAVVLIVVAAPVVLVGVVVAVVAPAFLLSDSGSTSNGATRSAQRSRSAENLRGVAFSDARLGWASGIVTDNGNYRDVILATTNGVAAR